MTFAVRDIDAAVFHVINQTVFFIDTAAVLALQVPGKGLGFAHPFQTAVAFDIPDQLVDPFRRFLVLGLPVQVILPGVV